MAAAQERVQTLARQWCDERLDQLAGMPRDPRAFPAFFAGCVDDWAWTQRRLGFAWREGQLLRIAGPAGRALQTQWQMLWAGFWQEATARFALERGARMAHHVFENESFLHMIDWRRSVDRAGLDDYARGLGAWLAGEPVPPSPWRDCARAAALAAMPDAPDHDATTESIVAAAAALIERSGPGGLTHRAVAEQAGLTLGVVSHRIRTKAELLQTGYDSLYRKSVARLRARMSVAPSRNLTPAEIADLLAGSPDGRGVDALHLAVARDPALRQVGLQLRYLRGGSSRALLAMLRPEQPQAGHLEAALLSGFLSSLVRSHAGWPAMESRAPILAGIEHLVTLF